MNRKISICILILITLCIVLIVFAKNTKNQTQTSPKQESQQVTETELTVIASSSHTKTYRYIARIVEERLVIFEADGQTVFFETDIRKEDLSEEMQSKAVHGIGFKSEANMYDFLESYSS